MPPRPLDWRCSPADALRRWPRSLPMAALVSGEQGPSSRWSILGVAAEWRSVPHGCDRTDALCAFHALSQRWVLPASEAPAPPTAEIPFRGGWIGFLSYELASLFEPAMLPHGAEHAGFERAGGWHCAAAAVHDAQSDRWWWCAPPRHDPPQLEDARETTAAASLGPIRARSPAGRFASIVERAIDLIHAGDIYQANLAQWFEADFHGSARSLAATAIEASTARHGAVVECPDGRAVISMSPELFLECRGRRVITRPIKGTRPQGADRRELLESEKDRAELDMIVDLMRNDLSRVCRAGSVRVATPRRVESHCGVEHAVAEVEGMLRPGATTADLLRAAFPPGSVTGAPKIRAMQVIDELEIAPRGPYCGAVGLVGDDGDLMLNVAIRTLLLRDGIVACATGCGIVADSVAAQEEAESLMKLAPFRRVASLLTPREAAAGAAAAGS